MLIITYTSSHNHPAPDPPSSSNLTPQPQESQNKTPQHHPATSKLENQQEEEKEGEKNHKPATPSGQCANPESFHYLESPIQCSEDIIIDQGDPFELNPEKTHGRVDVLLEKEPLPLCYSQFQNLSTPTSEEHDFFDELEELPISSPFLNFTRNNFSDERIAVAPS